MATKLVPVTFLKSHHKYAYFAGDNGKVNENDLEALVKGGFVTVFPGDDGNGNENPLPNDCPYRDLLFKEGFKTLEDITKAGQTLQDVKGIGKVMCAEILEYAQAKK